MILLVLAVQMVIGQGQSGSQLTEGKDPMQLAQVPLAVPYLLNPVGIVGLVTISAEAKSLPVLAAEIAILVVVLLLDLVVFRWASRVGQTLVRQTPGWHTIPVASSNGDGSWTITNGEAAPFIGGDEWASGPGVELLTGALD